MTTHPICTLVVAALLVPTLAAAQDEHAVPTRHNEATVAQLQAEMASGRLSSEELTREYLTRIFALDQDGPGVNSVIELNPDALAMARKADALRRSGVVLGPLHGIPVLLKDNIDTGDKMQTSAGSFALVGTPALRDSTVAANLRAGGAVILGKTNLSEWANFRSSFSISGWSGRGGQTHNPYGIDRNPCGSSAGSALTTVVAPACGLLNRRHSICGRPSARARAPFPRSSRSSTRTSRLPHEVVGGISAGLATKRERRIYEEG